MDQSQDTNYVIEEPDTSSQGPTPVTDETAAQEAHEQTAREEREAAEREAARKRVEDAINSGMADIG